MKISYSFFMKQMVPLSIITWCLRSKSGDHNIGIRPAIIHHTEIPGQISTLDLVGAISRHQAMLP